MAPYHPVTTHQPVDQGVHGPRIADFLQHTRHVFAHGVIGQRLNQSRYSTRIADSFQCPHGGSPHCAVFIFKGLHEGINAARVLEFPQSRRSLFADRPFIVLQRFDQWIDDGGTDPHDGAGCRFPNKNIFICHQSDQWSHRIRSHLTQTGNRMVAERIILIPKGPDQLFDPLGLQLVTHRCPALSDSRLASHRVLPVCRRSIRNCRRPSRPGPFSIDRTAPYRAATHPHFSLWLRLPWHRPAGAVWEWPRYTAGPAWHRRSIPMISSPVLSRPCLYRPVTFPSKARLLAHRRSFPTSRRRLHGSPNRHPPDTQSKSPRLDALCSKD